MIYSDMIYLEDTRADSPLLKQLSLDYTPADSLFASTFLGWKATKGKNWLLEIVTPRENGDFQPPMET